MESAEKARQMIREITVEAEVGKTYSGKVVRLEDYGAFVEILPNIVGLLHISEVAHYRIRNIRDTLRIGQTIRVKVLDIGEDHKIKLSKKALEKDSDRQNDFDRKPQKKPHFNSRRYDRKKF